MLLCVANHLQGLECVHAHTTQTGADTHICVYVFAYADVLMISLIDVVLLWWGRLEILIFRHLVLGARVTETGVDVSAHDVFL